MTIENLGNLTIRINGPDEREYAYTDFDLQNIPYDGAVSLYFITKINFDLTAELVDNKSPYALIVHNSGTEISSRNVDSLDVTLPSDGYYEIVTLVIPTTTYIEDGLGYTIGSKVTSDLHTNIIAAEVKDNRVFFKILAHTQDPEEGYYTHIWSEWQDINVDEMLDILEQSVNTFETSVQKHTASAFVYDNLYKCYINKATELLSLYTGDSGMCAGSSLCKDSIDKTKIQIRDYLWMAINVIKYCIQNCQYLKALKILNCVTTCAGICSDVQTTNLNTKITKDCGCSKRPKTTMY